MCLCRVGWCNWSGLRHRICVGHSYVVYTHVASSSHDEVEDVVGQLQGAGVAVAPVPVVDALGVGRVWGAAVSPEGKAPEQRTCARPRLGQLTEPGRGLGTGSV